MSLPPSAIPATRPAAPAPRGTPRPPVAPRPVEHAASEAPREPIPFRRPGGVTVVVHVAGFSGQQELLTFAGIMEQSPDFSEVSLTRVAEDEAWMTVRAETADEVARALTHLPGFPLDVRVDQNLVEGRVRNIDGSRCSDLPSPANGLTSLDGGQLLPQRPRFRAFRPQSDVDADERTVPPVPSGLPASALPPRSLDGPDAPRVPEARPRPVGPVPPTPPAPATRKPRTMPPPTTAQEPTAPGASMARTDTPTVPTQPSWTTSQSDLSAIPGVPNTTAPTRIPPRPAAPEATPQLRTSPRPAAPPPATQSGEPAAAPSAASQRPPVDEPADDSVEPEDRPGGAVMTVEHLTLVVYPFHSFAALNEFQAAIRRLHGVKNTRVRRFYRGTLHLAVDYEDMIPLSDRMADLRDVEFEVASESRSEIEIVLQDSSPLAAAGDS